MDLIKKYDYNNLITQQDINIIIQDIDKIFEDEGWVEESASFQTWPYLFTFENFYKFKYSFILSCFSYLEKEVPVSDIRSWCYMDYYDNWKLKDHENLWHSHDNENETKLSGIFYLNVPQGNDYPSTEFKHENNILFQKFCWFIFPSHLIHRPGKITSNKKRYVLAADMTYEGG